MNREVNRIRGRYCNAEGDTAMQRKKKNISAYIHLYFYQHCYIHSFYMNQDEKLVYVI
jgi:hypothetical protein